MNSVMPMDGMLPQKAAGDTGRRGACARGGGITMFEKLWWALLPYAGCYAYDDGSKCYKWYDKLAHYVIKLIPMRWIK